MQMHLAQYKRNRQQTLAHEQAQAVIGALQDNPHGLTLASVQRIAGLSCTTARILLRTHAVCIKDKYYPKPKIKDTL